MITIADVEAAATRLRGLVIRTPALASEAVSAATGADVVLKLDNLQVTGAFKERGAANRLSLLTAAERARGVIAMSAGNHAQAVARHAKLLGVPATIVMPKFTPSTKVTRTAAWGAKVVLRGETLAEAAAHARHLAELHQRIFVHPYDDPAVIAGQGTLALELMQDAPDLDALVIPVGGGGLLAGCLIAAMAAKPGIAVYGVEVDAYAAMAQRLAGHSVAVGGATIAEGIAVRDIGEVPFEIIRRRITDVLVVPERAVEEAIGLLIEGAKTVAEGAGAAGIAALLTFPERFRGKKVGVPITGGNIDTRILSDVLLRTLLRDGRLLRLHMRIPDRPGVLADIAGKIGERGGNIIEVSHQRLHAVSSVQAAELEVMVEARDPAHADTIAEALEQSYTVSRL
jgi:threonine dehydratase